MEEQEIMTSIDCDTKKIKSCGQDIVALADDYEEIIETIFTYISNLNTREDGWQGDDADRYIAKVTQEKEIYINLYNNLKRFGMLFQETAEKIETTMRKVEINNE